MTDKFDFINATDKPALVVCSNPAWAESSKNALQELGYKVHTVTTHDDFTTRFSQVRYQVIIIEDLFNAPKIEENASLNSLKKMPMGQRRHATIVLLGSSFKTFAPMQAYQHSVHAVINGAEVIVIKQLVEKAIADNTLFLYNFREVQSASPRFKRRSFLKMSCQPSDEGVKPFCSAIHS
ncbi:MAG: hypothetical protein WDM76_14420 [Limisphaerales bacterium]